MDAASSQRLLSVVRAAQFDELSKGHMDHAPGTKLGRDTELERMSYMCLASSFQLCVLGLVCAAG